MTRTANRRHDAWAEERNNPRRALATLAVQLDAFEMRAGEALKAGVRSQAAEGEMIGGQ